MLCVDRQRLFIGETVQVDSAVWFMSIKWTIWLGNHYEPGSVALLLSSVFSRSFTISFWKFVTEIYTCDFKGVYLCLGRFLTCFWDLDRRQHQFVSIYLVSNHWNVKKIKTSEVSAWWKSRFRKNIKMNLIFYFCSIFFYIS